ncbi:MAG: bifunctional riboflavin kinase/FAD synthetase [Sphingobacteriales bacterium]|nr:MAG: bifunctional riboflavin kinase/FAD synthetase [Sphingobacteriales bacterium]
MSITEMAIFYDTDQLPEFQKAVLTIGTFDGVHQGHKQILEEVVLHARQVNGTSIVITFEPHPRKLLFPGQSLGLLTPLEQKLDLITAAGIENIIVAPFTLEFSRLSAEQYIEAFVVDKVHPETIIIGYDHHFGHDRAGNIGLLRAFQEKFGYHVLEIPAQLIDQAAVSSTKIRKALNTGKVEHAAVMLGRNYSMKGVVIEGAQLGRTLGYPTANLELIDPDQLIPAIGIYAVRVNWKGGVYNAMMSIGYNPTVSDAQKLNLEIHLFRFHENIYGEELEVFFVARLRNEEKFPSVEALREQLHKDKAAALALLA